MLGIGGSQIMIAACRSRRLRGVQAGVGVQNSLVRAAQLMIAEQPWPLRRILRPGRGKSVLDEVVDDRGER
jgi:hypothetical protein